MLPADLDIQDLSKRHGARRVVDALTFSHADGGFLSVLGPPGCGKTSLLRLIAGFAEPDAGTIRVGGADMRGLAPKHRPVNVIFPDLALFPGLSVGENVGYGLARRKLSRHMIAARVGAVLERVGLPGAEGLRVAELAIDQALRVALARGLVLEPALLLLDEPLLSADPGSREAMKHALKQLQAAFGTSFVLFTRDVSEALQLSDRVAVMNQGRFEQVGAPRALYQAPETAFVAGFLGPNNRIVGRATGVAGDAVEIVTAEGLYLFARRGGPLSVGDAVAAYVRPEVLSLARDPALLVDSQPRFDGYVDSLWFDGPSSAVLLREPATQLSFRVTLPQAAAWADLKVGERVAFSFDPEEAICFRT